MRVDIHIDNRPSENLRKLAELVNEIHQLQEQLEHGVKCCRAMGVTWQQLADIFDCSRQAVYQRWADACR